MIICTIPTSGCTPQTIVIGRRTTYDTLQVVFDLSYLAETYGSGAAVLVVKRSQDTTAYPATIAQDGNTLTWTISEADTYYVGAGECELMWYVNNGLAKTIIYPVVVMRDILQTAEEPPDAYENWVEHLTELGAETQQHALDAAQSAAEAETAQGKAEDAQAAAETAQGAAEEAAGRAETAIVHAPVIQGGYWYIWNNGQYVNTNVRAEGQKGDKGDTGEKGDTGNGIASITKTGTSGLVDTYTVTYTDGTTTTFTVTNGAKGDKGDTGATGNGIASITKTGTSGNVDTYTITYTNGQTTTFTVTNGAVSSVAGKTGAVTLDANDVAFSESGTYDDGTVGKELSNQKNAIDEKAPVIINTASGDIATFADGADDMPIKHLIANIEAVQSGTGDPSPTNVRPITGWTGLTGARNGVNQWDEDWEVGGIGDNGQNDASSNRIRSKGYIGVVGGETYYTTGRIAWFEYDVNKAFLREGNGGNFVGANASFTPSVDAYFIRFICTTSYGTTYNHDISINYPSTNTDYHSGTDNQTISVSWQSQAGTVYGGTLDVVTGELTVTDVMVYLGTLEWTYNSSQDRFIATLLGSKTPINNNTPANITCSHYKTVSTNDNINIDKTCGLSIYNTLGVKDTSYGTDASAFTTAMSGVQLVYELATPQTYQLDPVTVETLYRSNTIYVDCGSVTVDYPADTELAVEDMIEPKADKTNYVTLSGTIVTQTGADNTMYLCGELAELTFNTPAVGQTAIRFRSGTTPTVASFPNVTEWMGGFDPDNLEASKLYEINVLYGVGVAQWT